MDFKLENILIGDDELLKICDFGFACSVDELIRKKIGTEGYIAPEVHNVKDYLPYTGITADIFSLGIVMFMLAFGTPPIHMATNNDPNYRILKRDP